LLRSIFNEERRRDEGLLQKTNRAIELFGRRLRELHPCDKPVPAKWIRLDLWAESLKSTLNELEQSIYCSAKYAAAFRNANGAKANGARENGPIVEKLSEELRDHYRRHIYFYKNAFIRVFSVLDKTGYFLDTMFDANTAQIKQRFSYFTVLRRLHDTGLHPVLEKRLYRLKDRFQEPLDRLRKQRNLEIHSMNVELIDEVWRARSCFAEYHYVEPLDEHLNDLDAAFEMVCGSLYEIFTYCTDHLREQKRSGYWPKRR